MQVGALLSGILKIVGASTGIQCRHTQNLSRPSLVPLSVLH